MADPDKLEHGRLNCVECGRESAEGERFRAYLTVDDDIAIFCGDCAEREFGEGDDVRPIH